MLMTKGGEATAWAAGLHPPRRLRRMENGQSIGRIREEREFKPGREWFWSLPGAHRAGVPTWGYGATLDAAKAAFRAHWEAFKNCPILTGRNSKGLPYCVTSRTRP